MAGIGFRLNKILFRQTYEAIVQAYGYASLISSGPWLLAIVALALIQFFLRPFISDQDFLFFFSSLTYIFSVSMILTGPAQMILTRHAADLEYLGESPLIHRAYFRLTALWTFFATCMGAWFFLGHVYAPPLVLICCTTLFVIISNIWLIAVCLGGLQSYEKIAMAYGVGYVTSCVGAIILGVQYGFTWLMVGFLIGQIILFLILFKLIHEELGAPHPKKHTVPNIWQSFLTYWKLALFGFFFYLGIWIDKFLFWYLDPYATPVSGLLFASPLYDQATCISIISIAPGMAIFFLKVETDFAIHFRKFFDLVREQATWAQLQKSKSYIIIALKKSLLQLIKVQGIISLTFLGFAHPLAERAGLGTLQTGVFEILLLAVFVLLMLHALITILFYLDKRFEVMLCSLALLMVNAGCTAWNIFSGTTWYGLGFLLGISAAFVLAAFFVTQGLRHLEYDTFTSQPLYPKVKNI